MSTWQSCLLFVIGVLCIAVSLICVKPKRGFDPADYGTLVEYFVASEVEMPDGSRLVGSMPSGVIDELWAFNRPLTWVQQYDVTEYLCKKHNIERPWSFRRAWNYVRRQFYPAKPVAKQPSP